MVLAFISGVICKLFLAESNTLKQKLLNKVFEEFFVFES